MIQPAHQVLATKGWWLSRLAAPNPPRWKDLAIQNFKSRYAPDGWDLDIFWTTSGPAALRHKGLWMDILEAWRGLKGHFGDDFDPVSHIGEVPFHLASLAGEPLAKYAIKKGRAFRRDQLLPPTDHDKWLKEDPSCRLEWEALWKNMTLIKKVVPPAQFSLWWRCLHHNLMTADRTSHANPATSPLCKHCGAVPETPRHLLFQCRPSEEFWIWILKVTEKLVGRTVGGMSTQWALFPFDSGPPQARRLDAAIHSWALWTIMSLHWGAVFDNKAFSFHAIRAVFSASLSSFVKSQWVIAGRAGREGQFKKFWCLTDAISVGPGQRISVSLPGLN